MKEELKIMKHILKHKNINSLSSERDIFDALFKEFRVPYAKKVNKFIDPSIRVSLVLKGCALGDYAGQPFEGAFRQETCLLSEDELYETSLGCTDDTVLTCATASVIHNFLSTELHSYEKDENLFANAYKTFAKEYPAIFGGYGSRFLAWAYEGLEPNSCGNGSAMRVSPCGCFFTQEKVIIEAYLSAICTHNHPEGIKGAIIIAMCIWMAFNGYSKKAIGKYVSKHYKNSPYSPTVPLQKINNYAGLKGNPAICQTTVPLAVNCFTNSKSFEDCITKAIQFGFDTDTQAAIAGSIAAAYYKKFDEKSEMAWKKIMEESPYVKKEINSYETF